MTGTSSVTGLNILNSPVQTFSIDGSSGLTITGAIIDNSAGDAGGLAHNTDAFDVGSSSNIHIVNPTVHNQDDCLAINSGTVGPDPSTDAYRRTNYIDHCVQRRQVHRWSRPFDRLSWWSE
jgi:polygalacturonase